MRRVVVEIDRERERERGLGVRGASAVGLQATVTCGLRKPSLFAKQAVIDYSINLERTYVLI